MHFLLVHHHHSALHSCPTHPHTGVHAGLRYLLQPIIQSLREKGQNIIGELTCFFHLMVNPFLRAVDRYRPGISIGTSHVNRWCRFLTFAFGGEKKPPIPTTLSPNWTNTVPYVRGKKTELIEIKKKERNESVQVHLTLLSYDDRFVITDSPKYFYTAFESSGTPFPDNQYQLSDYLVRKPE